MKNILIVVQALSFIICVTLKIMGEFKEVRLFLWLVSVLCGVSWMYLEYVKSKKPKHTNENILDHNFEDLKQ